MSPPERVELELEAVDAALAGNPVDPAHAELAELALLLAQDRPVPDAAAAARMNARLARLAPAPKRSLAAGPRRSWLRPAYGAGLALTLVLAALVIVLPGRASRNGPVLPAGGTHAPASAAGPAVATSTGSERAPQHGQAAGAASGTSASAGPQALGSLPPGPALGSIGSQRGPAYVPLPQSNGRRVVHSDALVLLAPAGRIATVAQELFDAVGAEQGIVEHSQVGTGAGAYASFTLSIPTVNLPAALSRLAQLPGARVGSSTASSADVNNEYLDLRRALADAQTLRSSLLGQLTAASTTTEIDSLKAQIGGAERSIAADEAALARLNRSISFTPVTVQIEPVDAALPVPGAPRRGLGSALHSAERVLTVTASVVIVALAVLAPAACLIALAGTVRGLWRRRRRERALDGV